MIKSTQPTNAFELSPKDVRQSILRLCHDSSEGHIASSFSIVEILISIYMVNYEFTEDNKFDNIVLSKGHAVYALYALMLQTGLYDKYFTMGVCNEGSNLIGHVPQLRDIGLNIGTGSLGHGFPYAVGRAFGNNDHTKRMHVIVGDGELNEGSIWETLNILEKFPNIPINLYIDDNHSSDRAIPLAAARDALVNSYNAESIDGHQIGALSSAIRQSYGQSTYKIFLCNTVKGYPISDMVDNPSWHHRVPTDEELCLYLNELKDYA
jgi:transketolase